MPALLAGVDTVIHAAAWTSLWGNCENSRALFLQPTLELLACCRQEGVGRIVFPSTTAASGPEQAYDPFSAGAPKSFWPHLGSVVAIENALRDIASPELTTVTLRLGLFAGEGYGLGLLPILTPRLKTHLVPWVAGGRTRMPLIDGRDIGQAMALAATVEGVSGYQAFNIVGPQIPTVREVIDHLHARHGLPRPHFSVPFPMAYAFAWLMERFDAVSPWDPLVTRSIIHLLEDRTVDNARAHEQLGYAPQHGWREAIDIQMAQMAEQQKRPMAMRAALP
ncbi:putative nucleoside-diphosphate-sugar epimerase [Magnetofaba australis IT-1]|uniref:Putative nucleoside-diphosphate-sugar epimerase n=1 Tax=Magnetofaba australis IT-1 TaxID=1434232 RepID=A0A1Y2K2Z4_9PROT|nr:putative nucleoside-diphosphate-sugar epimerase [Magnetofaba australis IT-1]